MADNTIIDINSIPETKSVLSTDKIWIFSNHNGIYEKHIVSFNDISSYFVDAEFANRLSAKYTELLNLSADFIKFIKEKYPTEDYVMENYTQTSAFMNAYNDLNSVDSIKRDYLNDYATEDDNLLKKNKTYAKFEKTMYSYGEGMRAEIIRTI